MDRDNFLDLIINVLVYMWLITFVLLIVALIMWIYFKLNSIEDVCLLHDNICIKVD